MFNTTISKKLFDVQALTNYPHAKQSYLDHLETSLETGDITFIVNNTEFTCIRSLIAIHSKPLTNMLYPQHSHGPPSRVNLNDFGVTMDSHSFDIIRKWCYGIDTNINLTALMDVFIFSTLFNISELQMLCQRFIDRLKTFGKKLYERRIVYLLSNIEKHNLYPFIPFSIFSKFIFKTNLFKSNLSPEELWKLCLKFSKNKCYSLIDLNKTKQQQSKTLAYDTAFLQQCVQYFKFENFNVNFLMKHVIPRNILQDKHVITLLSKHIMYMTNITNPNHFASFNHDKLQRFEPYEFKQELIRKINDAQYFRKISRSTKYKLINLLDRKLSSFSNYFEEYHVKKRAQLISHPVINDVVFEIDYESKTDNRIPLSEVNAMYDSNAIHNVCNEEDERKVLDEYDDNETETKCYDAVFALFAAQSKRFKEMMNEHCANNSNIVTITDMKPSTFRFLRAYFYGNDHVQITPYNVLDLYFVSQRYGVDVIRECCLCYFTDLNLYHLSTQKLLHILLCIDSFSDAYGAINNGTRSLISLIFERCPRFALKREFTDDQLTELLANPLLLKLSLNAYRDLVFASNKFVRVSQEHLFVNCIRFAKRKGNKMRNVLETLATSKYFSFGDHLVIDVMMKVIQGTDLDDYNGLKMVSNIYHKCVEKHQTIVQKQRIAEKEAQQQRQIEIMEKQWMNTNFVIYDTRCIKIENKSITCSKRNDLKPQYLLCLSDRGYVSGIHIFKYKLNRTDDYLAIGVSTICNKLVKSGHGLYHMLGYNEEKEGELLGGYFVCVWSDGVLLKYVNGKNVIKHRHKKWRNSDVVTVKLNCNDWMIGFERNEKVIDRVKLDENLTYYPVIQMHTRSNHNMQIVEEKHTF